jgi:hypothetical protein
VKGGELQTELTDIQNFDMTAKFRQLEEGYLGEKSNRTDYIYDGAKGKLDLHIHNADWFDFLKAMKDKAQRNTPDVQFNIAGIFSFPNGQTRAMTIPDVSFGDVPHSVGNRGEYVKVSLDFAAGDFSVADA